MSEDKIVLAIESSCDETAAAVVKNGRYILSNIISSQIETHIKYGGVVPEIASRKHIENISQVVDAALLEAGISFKQVDAIAVTCGPGLVGALLVGVSYAKALAYALNKPLIGVHHIEGHICSNFLENENFVPPFIALVVSGGHTHLVHVMDYGVFEILGQTKDDAAGEAYDKVARAIGLGYPGGPEIDRVAKLGNESAIKFPKALMEEGILDFSFSGLKSSVLNYLNKCSEPVVADVAASFQKSVVEVLVIKAIRACKMKNIKKLALAGGVASNTALRAAMIKASQENAYELNIPKAIFCTDNAAMIASAAYFEYIKGYRSGLDLNAYPGLRLGKRLDCL